jgi:hypothetical protein
MEVAAVQPRHIAKQDVTADRVPRLLGATMGGWKGRVATVFPQADDYANDALRSADAAARDASIGGIGELMTQDYSAAFAN